MLRPRVLLADDHTIVAESLAVYLRGSCDLVGIVDDGRKLVAAALELRPEVIVADMAMPIMTGLEALKQLKTHGIKAKVIFLTMHADPLLASSAMRAGAAGYLLKHSAGEELITAIKAVLRGGTYLSPLIAEQVVDALSRPEGAPVAQLTPRQFDVLRLIAEGRGMKGIAAALNISTRTVETHKYEMMRKLGVRTTAELIRFAISRDIAAAVVGQR